VPWASRSRRPPASAVDSDGAAQPRDRSEDRDPAELRLLGLGLRLRRLLLRRTVVARVALGVREAGHAVPSGEGKYDDHRTIGSKSVVQWIGMTATTLEHPAVETLEMTAILHALSDPVRLQIARELAAEDTVRSCGSFDVPV